MKLIVGLGNPGTKYEATRHNVGFMVADLLADRLHGRFQDKKRQEAMLARAHWGGKDLFIAKPLTYMNDSGRAVRALLDYYRLTAEDLIVVVDDLTLEPGVLRLRARGSSGGQNGIQSIIDHLGTQSFWRIKVGIGKPAHGQAIRHVLGHFTDEQWDAVKPALTRASDACLALLEEGIERAMNRFNG